jgi:hypothetical protein
MMPLWLTVGVVVVSVVAVTGAIAYLIDRLNHSQKSFTTEDTEDTKANLYRRGR